MCRDASRIGTVSEETNYGLGLHKGVEGVHMGLEYVTEWKLRTEMPSQGAKMKDQSGWEGEEKLENDSHAVCEVKGPSTSMVIIVTSASTRE